MAKGVPSLQFFAAVSSVTGLSFQQIATDSGLQDELSAMFNEQSTTFLGRGEDALEVVPYNPKEIYQLEKGQVYVIKEFDLPKTYFEAAIKPHQTDKFTLSKRPFPSIAAVVGSEVAGRQVKRLLFQQFRSPQLLDRNFTILSMNGQFDRVKHNGISLSHELSAIWQDRKLYFRSFAIASRFFDLEEFEPKATDAEVATFVADEFFFYDTTDDRNAVNAIIGADDFLRRRVASILSRKILETVDPKDASKKALAFGVQMDVKNKRVALPKTKKDLKTVVKFLNEEYFHGELTDELLETNSLRKVSK